jgi:hypothetical protein
MVRYFGPGHTGTVETIFRLATDRSPDRWDKSAMSASERKFWDKLREDLGDGSRSVENISLKESLMVEVPRPHDAGLWERYCDVMDACRALRMSLDSGAIRANYRDENGVQHAVSVEFWRGDDECVVTALLDGAAYLDVASNHELISCRLLRLPTPELNKAWPELISRGFRESKGDETTSTPRRVGRPPKYDWDAIEHKAMELMCHHGEFSNDDPDWNAQACLERALLEFCSHKFGSEPSLSTLRDPKHIPRWLFTWHTKRASI